MLNNFSNIVADIIDNMALLHYCKFCDVFLEPTISLPE